MPAKLKPRKFVLTDRCSGICSLNPRNLPGGMAQLLHGWYEAGDNDKVISKKADEVGHHLSQGAISRHRAKHLEPADHVIDIDGPGEARDLSDLDVLERIITKGATQIKASGVKISPEMTLKAMELKYKLTQGNVFEAFTQALAASFEEAPDGPPAGEAGDDAAAQP